jgi:hypothetical protein
MEQYLIMLPQTGNRLTHGKPVEDLDDVLPEEYNTTKRGKAGDWENLKPITRGRAREIGRNLPGLSFCFLLEMENAEPVKCTWMADTGIHYEGGSI